MRLAWLQLFAILFFVFAATCCADSTDLFENQIRPLLVKHCYKCHSVNSKKVRAGLLLDSRQGWERGGESGETIVVGDPRKSLLIHAVRYEDPDLLMPPSGKLSDHEIASLEQWIRQGAFDPRNESIRAVDRTSSETDDQNHWAFLAPVKTLPPSIEHSELTRGPIDEFIHFERQRLGLDPVGPADRQSLLRRASFDLVGLPPSPELVKAFRADSSPAAYVRIVDQLLSSPQFGERWGRHWLDVARFADSVGSTKNLVMINAWRYRNYVIDSFNDDKPYDHFVREQIAGDLMPASTRTERIERLIATGFLVIGERSLAEQDPKILRSEVIAETVDTLGRTFLGLSLSCARCHDHKFAPIPTEDFYALAGIFHSTQRLSGFGRLKERRSTQHRFDLLHDIGLTSNHSEFCTDRDKLHRQLERLAGRLDYLNLRKRELEDADPFDKEALEKVFEQQRETRKEWTKLNQQFADKYQLAMGVRDAVTPVNASVEVGGDPYRQAEPVERRFLTALHPSSHDSDLRLTRGSGRLELANWLTDRANPLLARVTVNRIWSQLFGRGLVRTVDDYTTTGAAPSHPELLDYLAVEYIERGYSTKDLIRRIVLSDVYQQSTDFHDANYTIDPENQYLWRMNQRRLELEPLRDALLAISGKLDLARPAAPLAQFEEDRVPDAPDKWPDSVNLSFRTVYLPVLRRAIPAMYLQFDFPPPGQVIGARSVTTVPTQALFLMNSPFVAARSVDAAKQLLHNAPDFETRVQHVFLGTVGRIPTITEFGRLEAFTSEQSALGKTEQEIWEDIYHARFSSAEFIYRN